jgi:hypothetical protein
VQAFAIITVVFAVLDYLKVNMKDNAFFDLPEVPEAKMKISLLEPIFGITISIATTILLLGFPHVIGARLDGSWVTVFDVAVVRGLWFPILIWTLLELVAEAVKLVEGRYNVRMAAVAVVAGVLQIVCAVAVLGNNQILNPEFISHVEGFGAGVERLGGYFNTFLLQPNRVILVVALGILIWEMVDVLVKTFLAKK